MKNIRKIFNLFAKKDSGIKPVHIETPRLTLREIAVSDTDRLHQITSAPGFFYCYFDGTRKSVEDFVARSIETANVPQKKRTEYLLAVEDKSTGELIGHASLETQPLVDEYTHSINFFIDPTMQNKGYGREAVINLMRHALEELGMPGFGVTIDPANKPSLKVAANEGYRAIGETTLETTRGVEPRVILVFTKAEFYEQRKNDKVAYMLPKKPANNNGLCKFFKKNAP